MPWWAWDALEAAELWDKGLPPRTGGQDAQPAALLDAARYCWAHVRYWRVKLLGPMAWI